MLRKGIVCRDQVTEQQMAQARKVIKSSADSWRMEETYIKVKGEEWGYQFYALTE